MTQRRESIEREMYDSGYKETIRLYGDKASLWVVAEIQSEVPREGGMSLVTCRYAALRVHNKGLGYVVYDRLLSRIVDGVYYDGKEALLDTLAYAQRLNETGYEHLLCCRPPSSAALGLVLPSRENLPGWDGTWKARVWYPLGEGDSEV